MNLLSERLKLAIKLKNERDGQEVIQADLARACGSSDASVNYWLSDINGISAKKARLLAEFLGVDPMWLETGKGRPTVEPVNKYRQEVLKMLESTDERGQEKIFIAARDAYELHQAHKMRLDAEIQRVSEVNKAMSSDEPLSSAFVKSPTLNQH